MLVPIAAVMFAFGYVLQKGLINPFITRPEHSQFLLLVAIAIIIVNVLLIVFGPDAQNVQTSYAFDSFQIGPLIVDATKAYAGLAAIVVAAALFSFFRYSRVGTAIRACADNYTGALVVGLDVKHLYALTFGLGAACVGAAGAILLLIVDVTPAPGPAYTLLAFVIVITGGLGSMPGALIGGVLIGVDRGAGRPVVHAVGEEHVLVRHPGARPVVPPAGHHGQEGGMIARLIDGASTRALVLLGLVLAAALVAPLFAGDYLITVLILIFYFAYIGQAWNIMMGFAGQLSLGHALYVGLGGYAAAALYVHSASARGSDCWSRCRSRRSPAPSSASWLPLRRRGRLFRHPHHRGRGVRPRRLRPSELDRGLVRPVPAGEAICPQRSLAAARQPDHVLLRAAGGDRARLPRLPGAAEKPHRLFLAGDPRGRGGRARGRHRHLPLQDDGGGDFRRR